MSLSEQKEFFDHACATCTEDLIEYLWLRTPLCAHSMESDTDRTLIIKYWLNKLAGDSSFLHAIHSHSLYDSRISMYANMFLTAARADLPSAATYFFQKCETKDTEDVYLYKLLCAFASSKVFNYFDSYIYQKTLTPCPALISTYLSYLEQIKECAQTYSCFYQQVFIRNKDDDYPLPQLVVLEYLFLSAPEKLRHALYTTHSNMDKVFRVIVERSEYPLAKLQFLVQDCPVKIEANPGSLVAVENYLLEELKVLAARRSEREQNELRTFVMDQVGSNYFLFLCYGHRMFRSVLRYIE